MGMKPKVLVCQHGARRRYAIPRMLEEAGMLAALYTDSCALSPLGRLAGIVGKIGVSSTRLMSLAARQPVGIPKQKVFSSDRLFWSSFTKGRISPDLALDFKKWGLQGADIVYSMYGENPDFLKWVKQQGAKIVVDVFIHPKTNRIVKREYDAFPNAGQGPSDEMIAGEDEHSHQTFELADLLLAPSGWVADGICEFGVQYREKVRIVPYGNSIAPVQLPEQNRGKYFLFAGRDPLRKGLHYLAEAAAVVHRHHPDWEFRVAGLNQDDISWMPFRQHLTCMGKVLLEKMGTLYASAEAFVLPSLSEGQAGVILEALACGCPVVATRESGVDFGPEAGILVPSRDSKVLADAILKLADRVWRNQLGEGAIQQAAEYTLDAWAKRLMGILES